MIKVIIIPSYGLGYFLTQDDKLTSADSYSGTETATPVERFGPLALFIGIPLAFAGLSIICYILRKHRRVLLKLKSEQFVETALSII